jgi:hypothetical protein
MFLFAAAPVLPTRCLPEVITHDMPVHADAPETTAHAGIASSYKAIASPFKRSCSAVRASLHVGGGIQAVHLYLRLQDGLHTVVQQ